MIAQRQDDITAEYKARDHGRAKKINWETKHAISYIVSKF